MSVLFNIFPNQWADTWVRPYRRHWAGDMTYEQWDLIADSYTPLLFALYIAFSVYYFRSGDRGAPLHGLIGIIICYLIMLMDNAFEIWKMASLDYSTHSAVAFALVYFHLHKRRFFSPLAIIFLASLILYYALILYQRYHSALDILATLGVVAPVVFLSYRIPLNAWAPRMSKPTRRAG